MPVNVLCLHGCQQSNVFFQSLLKEYIKLGEKQYDLKFHFLEGKYDHSDGGKMWYQEQLVVSEIGRIPYKPEMVEDCLLDLDRSIGELEIDLLLGFSQGGNVVDSYLRTRQANPTPSSQRIRAAVIFSGYPFVYDSSMTPELLKPVTTPLLSVFSETDEVVPAKYRPLDYLHLEELPHEKGHRLPSAKPMVRMILGFLQANGSPSDWLRQDRESSDQVEH